MQSEKYPTCAPKWSRKLGLDDFFVTAQPQPSHNVESESRVEFQVARRSHDPVIVDRRCPEAGDELREAARGESQRRGYRGVDIAKAWVVFRPVRHRHRFDRLFRKDVTGSVDAIDTDILKRPTPGRCFQPMIPHRRLEAEHRLKE